MMQTTSITTAPLVVDQSQPHGGGLAAAGSGPATGFPGTPRGQAKRQPRVGSYRGVGLNRPPWLPLPEKTMDDRVKLHCPPGFVDRAYSVFL